MEPKTSLTKNIEEKFSQKQGNFFEPKHEKTFLKQKHRNKFRMINREKYSNEKNQNK